MTEKTTKQKIEELEKRIEILEFMMKTHVHPIHMPVHNIPIYYQPYFPIQIFQR